MRFYQLPIESTFVFLREDTVYFKLNTIRAERLDARVKRIQRNQSRGEYAQPKFIEPYRNARVWQCDGLMDAPYDHVPVNEWAGRILPLNWQHFGKRLEYKKSLYTIYYESGSIEHKAYEVILDGGEWVADNDLFCLCESRVPCEMSYDGKVEKSSSMALVTIYGGLSYQE